MTPSCPSRRALSIIIVNWNSAKYLAACLASIYDTREEAECEVIVIDNASYDGSAELVKNQFPQVIFIQSKENLGFAKANNLAYKRSSRSTLLFLNPDTEIIDGALARMYDHLHSRPGIGAVGCRMLNSDGSLQKEYVQAFPTIWNRILAAEVLISTFPNWKIWGIHPILNHKGSAVDVDVLAGSCIMLKRSVFKQVGLFDEQYFMYAEDVDLCFAIKKVGYSIHYVGGAAIIHHSGKSSTLTGDSHFPAIMQREASVIFFRKNRGKLCAAIYRGAVVCASLLRLILIASAAPFGNLLFERGRLYAAFKKWLRILIWALGLGGLSRAGKVKVHALD